MQVPVNCSQCKWWAAWGCNNSNWMSGALTDPGAPVCGGLSFAKRMALATGPVEPAKSPP